ncbi:hypothetical protein JKF63_06643 [Porcisia hertigi]|uniref:Uncharacterized protein n=1 Tax=Porcisia hertigi TaxID=2761500 RepID=A0A836LD46_9TRYP|nr:hypothetical protein JKF63_06643 [Porcisia hertigi]
MDPDTPSVLTSEVYNDAAIIFNMLQNKEKLVSFLDCTTLLRGMGMNPTHEDMDKLKGLMAQPILRLEQWRREEELKREKERRKEEARERKGKGFSSGRKATTKKVTDPAAEAPPVDITPVEEIKNIDWNIFIKCSELLFRDRMREERGVVEALQVFTSDLSTSMSRAKLVEIVTTNGSNVLTPAEVKMLVTMLPESCSVKEWAKRISGTYVPPTQEEIDAAAMREIEARRQQEATAKAKEAEKDPLEGL